MGRSSEPAFLQAWTNGSFRSTPHAYKHTKTLTTGMGLMRVRRAAADKMGAAPQGIYFLPADSHPVLIQLMTYTCKTETKKERPYERS